ncbi:hypothetical protein GGF32_004992, partial [Allomyces javanicus]
MTPLNILILDDADGQSVASTVTYSSFVKTGIDANLFIITSRKMPLSALDKKLCVAYVQLDCPMFDGSLELIARAWHDQYTIHRIHCKHEELLLRAAHLRRWFGIDEGMQPENTQTFRDKEAMKDRAAAHGFPVPKYQRLDSPPCLLSFIDRVGLPVVVKPTLGCSSVGIHVLRTTADVTKYLRTKFFGHLQQTVSITGQFDMSGHLLAESYLADAPMYHVNGLVDRGHLVAVWPFQYLRTNLDFAHGSGCGNVALLPGDAMYAEAVDATQSVLACYDLPPRFVFHLELFHVAVNHAPQIENARHGGKPYFALCELAGRQSSASVPNLIEQLIGTSFAHLEFRFNAGLSYTVPPIPTGPRVGDLFIPLHAHRQVVAMPTAAAFPDKTMQYVPIARANVVDRKDDAGAPCMAAWMIAT